MYNLRYNQADALNMLLLMMGYATLARLVLTFSSANGNVTIFWIPGGLALAALLVHGQKYWPAVFLGALCAGLMVHDPLLVSVALAVGNTLETLTAFALLQRIADFDLRMTQTVHFYKLAAVAAIAASISALIGPITLLLNAYLTPANVVNNLLHWWQADTLGIILGTPVFLVWREWPWHWFQRQRRLTTALFLLLAFLCGQMVFFDWFERYTGNITKSYLMFLIVVWAAFYYGRHGAILITVMTTLQALLGAIDGVGMFGSDILQTGLQNFWLYILVLTFIGTALAINIEQRQHAEAVLKASRNRFFSIMQQSPLSMQISDVQGNILQVNKAWELLWGIAGSEALGQNVFSAAHLIKKGIVPATWQSFNRVQCETTPIEFSVQLQASEDQAAASIKWIRAIIYPIKQPDQAISEVVICHEDISERKEHEEQIQRLTKAYAALAQTNRSARHAKTEAELFQAACRIAVEEGGIKMTWIGKKHADSDAVIPVMAFGAHLEYLDGIQVSVDPEIPEGRGPVGTAYREGRAVVKQDFCSDEFTKPWQLRAQQMGKWGALAVFPIMKKAETYAVMALYHGEINAFDDLIVSLLHAVVTDIGFALEVLDIELARQTAEAELRANEERFRKISDLIPEQIWTAKPNGQLDYVNQRVIDFTGQSFADLIESGWQELLHPLDVDQTVVRWQQSLEVGQAYENAFRVRHTSGQYRWCIARALPAYDENGQISKWYGVNTDITEQKKVEEQLRLTERVFQTTQEGIVITDPEGHIIEVNAAFSSITGYTRDEVVGKNPRLLKSGQQDAQFYVQMWDSIMTTGHWSGELWNRRKDGDMYPEWITISAIKNEHDCITHYVGISSDITLLKQHEKQLEHIAHYDALTGIPNRILLIDRLQQALAHTLRSNELLAICYLDLDGFKPINDNLGHAAGDRVLVEIAKRIEQTLRGGDTIARLGGDEFVILLQGLEDTQACHLAIERLLQAIAQPIQFYELQLSVTASIGVTLYPLDDDVPDIMLRHADQAMYQAKQNGKNRYCIFDAKQDVLHRTQNEKLLRIEQALKAEEFELFYQPKVALITQEVMGFEALIRWHNPEQGLVAPNEFLPLLENTELEIRLGEWVIDAALTRLTAWNLAGLVKSVSINIAAAHLQSPGFVETLQAKLARFPAVLPSQLEIEILETAALSDILCVAETISACAKLGVHFALDDFGTGYSSLAYLRRLPADTLKIDQTFVRDMLIDKEDCSIVEGVIALARTFKRKTVAEGVETKEHFEVLRKMGCDIAQGYGIARPMPAAQIHDWCKAFVAQLKT